MTHAGFNAFAIIVSFIDASWESCHVTIGIFEIHNIVSVAMAN
jgi:hypothetical protein